MAEACGNCTATGTRLWHGYTDGCPLCAARGLARGPSYHRARETGRQHSAYRSDLARYGLPHEVVRQAAEQERARAVKE